MFCIFIIYTSIVHNIVNSAIILFAYQKWTNYVYSNIKNERRNTNRGSICSLKKLNLNLFFFYAILYNAYNVIIWEQ